MPCLLGLLAVAFPRVAIVLLWLFTSFFAGVYNNVVLPVVGFPVPSSHVHRVHLSAEDACGRARERNR